jgi:two-component system sensor histidine kinase HydH
VISVRAFEEKDNSVIEISDTGSGIPEEILPNIFEPLFTTKIGGTGLGLPICEKIIAEHNGSIAVKNNPTTFTIKIPKAQL